MNNLTVRATKYLSKLKRRSELCLDRETTIQYCRQQNFPLSEKLLDIQVNFSGYKLTIKNDSGHGFLLSLFSKADVKNNNEIETCHFGETYIIDFGEHETAPFHFYISNKGELCTLIQPDDDKPNIICSSIEKFVEQYALRNELSLQTKNPYYHDILDNEQLTNLLNLNFFKIEECCDKYSQWFTNGQLTIVKGTYLDRPEFYLHVYGKKRENCDNFINNLKQQQILS